MNKLLFFTLVLIYSCQTDSIFQKNDCGANLISNPLEDLQWLNNIKTSFEQSSSAVKKKIYQYTYNGNTVFLIDPCVSCPDGLQTVYDCSGNTVCEFGGIAGLNTCPGFSENSTNEILLWEN